MSPLILIPLVFWGLFCSVVGINLNMAGRPGRAAIVLLVGGPLSWIFGLITLIAESGEWLAKKLS